MEILPAVLILLDRLNAPATMVLKRTRTIYVKILTNARFLTHVIFKMVIKQYVRILLELLNAPVRLVSNKETALFVMI